jgi:hypothetical protein
MASSALLNRDLPRYACAAILGATAWYLPSKLMAGIDRTHADLSMKVGFALLLGIGGVLGYQRPEKPWRWGVASVALVPVVGIIFAPTPLWLVVQMAVAMVPGACSMAGAYAGAYLRGRSQVREALAADASHGRMGWAGFGLGLVASYPFELSASNIHGAAMLGIGCALVFASGLLLGARRPTRVARWAFAIEAGFLFAVIARIIVDTSRDPTSHNLFPIEILFALVLTAPLAFVGAYLGLLVRRFVKRAP